MNLPPRFRIRGAAATTFVVSAWLLLAALAAPAHCQPGRQADPNDPAAPLATEDGPPPEESSDDETELPSIDKMELPTFERLMKGPAVDWIVLPSKRVLEVEPVLPRPATVDEINKQIKQLQHKAGQPAETEAEKRRRLALYYLPVTLLEGEDREFKLHIKMIKEIIHYEDLMLRRIDQLLDDRVVRKAYELVAALESRHPNWPGVVLRKDRLYFAEAAVKLTEGQPQHALALLEALFERNPAFSGLEAQLGVVTDHLISETHGRDDLRQSRFFLKRLQQRYPNHRTATAWQERLIADTRELIDKAITIESSGALENALDNLETAARTWPELPELIGPHGRVANRFQRLRVGVLEESDPAGSSDPVVLSRNERRHRELTRAALFQPSRKGDKSVYYETRFFNEWDPTDLGHSVVFRLRPFRAPGESQPLVTAAGMMASLTEQIDPNHPRYDARFAAAVESIAVRSPFELVVQFRQAPLRPEALFAFAWQPAFALDDPASAAGGLTPLTGASGPTFPFQLRSRAEEQHVYERTIREPDSLNDRHIAQIREVRYASHARAIQGLLRGEVSLLPQVPVPLAKSLAARGEFFVQQYAQPATHILQFNPQSRPLKARTLRRSLIYAIDRQRLLEEIFLKEPAGSLGRVISAPFSTKNYAYDRFVVPHKFDPALAFSLARTAEKELQSELPPLKLVCPADPEAQSAAARIVEAWNKIGVPATIVDLPLSAINNGTEDAVWDIVYRIESLAEPLTELWPFLALTGSTETAALEHLPTWLRQQLLELDRAGDWKSAERTLHRLHRQFWAEVHLIPLWEVEEYMVLRKNIRNAPDRPMLTYQGIERWKVEPWYSRE